MAEKPILCSTPMVKALLEGRKTMTRRIIAKDDTIIHKPGQICEATDFGIFAHFKRKGDGESHTGYVSKWKPGDILWVRETWRIRSWDFDDGDCTIEFPTGDMHMFYLNDDTKEQSVWLQNQIDALAQKGILEMVTGDSGEEDDIMYKATGKPKPWKPSIHMPKEAARIWLEVVDVRPERIQDISPDDAVNEGIETQNEDYVTEPGAVHADYLNYMWKDDEAYKDYYFPYYADPVSSFKSLWESINGPYAWDANHWVWVITFRVLSTDGKPE